MAEERKGDRVTLEQLMVSTLAMTDAAIKLLIKKSISTDAEFNDQLAAERANYLSVLKRCSNASVGPIILTQQSRMIKLVNYAKILHSGD